MRRLISPHFLPRNFIRKGDTFKSYKFKTSYHDKRRLIQQAFEVAANCYAAVGVDVRKALEDMKKISYPCIAGRPMTQRLDISGFENQGGSLTGGIQNGNYPGRARTIDEVRGMY